MCLSANLLAAESVFIDRRTDAAPGVVEKVFKDAGYNVLSEFTGKPVLHVVVTHVEPNSGNGSIWLWNGLLMANYACPLKNDDVLVLGGLMQSAVETMTNPTIPQGKEKAILVQKNAAKGLLEQIKAGGLDESRKQCALIQSKFQ